MYRVESKTEEPILSKERKSQEKMKQFREYLVQKDVVLLIVKFLLSIKNAKQEPENLTKAFVEYLGEVQVDNRQLEEVKQRLQEQQNTKQQLLADIEAIKNQIQTVKQDKIKKQQEERLKREEEQAKKATKKPGKK